ncbi:MAG TPA: peptidoglycan DD-metalloendopeptidase family protein, partial [Adhaeribacter sp.]|nr:peptidoglycan DD-metalloendopeptidase family protein [Adhaeribacter sp.]
MPTTPEENNFSPLTALLKKHQAAFGKVTDIDLDSASVTRLDLSAANPLLTLQNLRDTNLFGGVIEKMLREKKATAGIGGYLENRVIYRRSQLFEEAEPRSLHLGIDIWAPAGTGVYAPLAATIHSFQDNAAYGDYGPTLILQHELEGTVFYTLSGHLDRASLKNLKPGITIAKGDKIAEFGPYPENGDWPPHL